MRRTLALLVAVCLPGCMLLSLGKTQTIPVTSQPPGALVTIDGVPQGLTPMDVQVRSMATVDFSLTKEGYVPYTTRLQPTPGIDCVDPVGVMCYPGVKHGPVAITLRPQL